MRRVFLLAVVATLLFTACAPSQPNVEATAQAMASTLVAQASTATRQAATETPAPAITPIATNTPTVTPTISTATPAPTNTPEPTATPTATATKAVPKEPVATVSATKPSESSSADDVFYVGYITCIGGTDVLHFLTGNHPNEIRETYRTEQYSFANQTECEASFQSRINKLQQPLTCVDKLPEPANADLKIVRQSSLIALGNLNGIRQSFFGFKLCMYPISVEKAIPAFNEARDHLRYVQTTLDKYRSEHGK